MKQENETQWKTTLKHSNDTDQWRTTIVLQWQQQWNKRKEKEQTYNNHTTIVRKWNPMKHTNDTRKWNPTMKTNIGTEQWQTAKKNNNCTTTKKQWDTRMKIQSFNNHTANVQQWLTN